MNFKQDQNFELSYEPVFEILRFEVDESLNQVMRSIDELKTFFLFFYFFD